MEEFLQLLTAIEKATWNTYEQKQTWYIGQLGRILRDCRIEIKEERFEGKQPVRLESLGVREWDDQYVLSLKKSLVLMYREAKKKEEN